MTQPSKPACGLGVRPTGVVLAAVFALSACSQPASSGWSGYAEGDYVYIAAPLGGQLQHLAVQAGDQVAAGAPLFALDDTAEQASLAQTQAQTASAQAQSANLDAGRRPQELAVTQAQLTQAQAAERLAAQSLSRTQQLRAQGFVSTAQVDDATTALKLARARVSEITAALNVAQLPARTAERQASQAAVRAAEQASRAQDWRVAQKHPSAPVAGQVSEVFFRVGEWVGAGQPVLSLLPPQGVHARFFVPEGALNQVQLGQAVRIHCDGCPADIHGKVSRVATSPEYTPPVIYSNAQRAKMVFQIEATPLPGQPPLHPGQPLDVTLANPGQP